MRVLVVSINTDIYMVIWRDPVIWEKLGISNIGNIYFLVPIFSKVNSHVYTPW